MEAQRAMPLISYSSKVWEEAEVYVKDLAPLFPKPSVFSRALAEALPINSETRLLDVGCGSGIVGIFAIRDV